MTWEILVFVWGIQGAYPTSEKTGNYSSLNVCREEKKNLKAEFDSSFVPDSTNPKIYYLLVCSRRS